MARGAGGTTSLSNACGNRSNLWKSVKYEEIDLHGYETVSEVRQALAHYFDFYNRRRPHSTLDRKTPDTAYFNPPLLAAAA